MSWRGNQDSRRQGGGGGKPSWADVGEQERVAPVNAQPARGWGKGEGTASSSPSPAPVPVARVSHVRKEPEWIIADERETGVIGRVAGDHGFVKCVERVEELFFKLSAVVEPSNYSPKAGDEVEFDVMTDKHSGKRMAGRLEILEPGTVQFEVVLVKGCEGTVQRSLQGRIPRGNERVHSQDEPFGGKICPTPCDDHKFDHQLYEFSYRDLAQTRHVPRKGDVVRFDIFLEKQSGRQGATNVHLVRPGGDSERLQGTVITVKEEFGFLRCLDLDTDLFFHFSEVINPPSRIAPGQEFEFTLERSAQRGKCLQLVALPRGTIKVELPLCGTFRGTVLRAAIAPAPQPRFHRGARNDKNSGGSSGGQNGIIAVTEWVCPEKKKEGEEGPSGEEEKKQIGVEVSFRLKDWPRLSLLEGDIVDFSLSLNRLGGSRGGRGRSSNRGGGSGGGGSGSKRTLVLSALSVAQVAPNAHQGAIEALQDDFGFIKRVDEDKAIFFHFSNITFEPRRLRSGLEVSFAVATGADGREHATRVTELPRGTVQFHQLSIETYTGVVTKSVVYNHGSRHSHHHHGRRGSRDGSGHNDAHLGSITLTSSSSQEAMASAPKDIVFCATGQVDPQEALLENDTVSFQIQTRIANGQLRASNIRLVAMGTQDRYTGVLTSCSTHFGVLTVLSPDFPKKKGASSALPEVRFPFSNMQAKKEEKEAVEEEEKGKEEEEDAVNQGEEEGGEGTQDTRRDRPRNNNRKRNMEAHRIGKVYEFSASNNVAMRVSRANRKDAVAAFPEAFAETTGHTAVVVSDLLRGNRAQQQHQQPAGQLELWAAPVEECVDEKENVKEGGSSAAVKPSAKPAPTRRGANKRKKGNLLSFTPESLSAPSLSLRKGDLVTFTHLPKLHLVTQIKLVGIEGHVLDSGNGRLQIKTTPAVHWEVFPSPPRQEILTVAKPLVATLSAGDKVKVLITSMQARDRYRIAKKVVVTEHIEAAFAAKGASNRERLESKGKAKAPARILSVRMAKGPDGTIGFAPRAPAPTSANATSN